MGGAMPRAVLSSALVVALAARLLACGASGEDTKPIDGGPGDTGSLAPDVSTPQEDAWEPPPLTTKCSGTFEARGVVLAVDGTSDEIRFMTQTGGHLTDPKAVFTGYDGPRRVAVRRDGLEATIAWGSFDNGYGVVTFSMNKDGTNPQLVANKKLGDGRLPFGLTYIGADTLLLAVSGGSKHELVTLSRGAAGFAESARVAAPGNFPYALDARGTTGDAVLARADLVLDTASSIHLMVPGDAGVFVTSGTVGKTSPPAIDLRVHPTGKFAYSQTDSPEDKLTPFHLDATGILHSVKIEDGGVTTLTKQSLPRIGTTLAVDPRGRFIVMQGNIYQQSTAQTPQVVGYRLMTAPLLEDGKAGPLYPQSDPIGALLFDDMQIAPSGHMLLGKHLASQETSIEIFAQPKLGEWEPCESIDLIGGASIGMAPY